MCGGLHGFLHAEGNRSDEFGESSRGPRVMWVLHVTRRLGDGIK